MLFRTIYGPELASIFFIIQTFESIKERELFDCFRAQVGNKKSAITNIKDTVLFLERLDIVYKKNSTWQTEYRFKSEEDFKLEIIKKIRDIHKKEFNKLDNNVDSYFIGIIDELFIKSNKTFLNELHTKINSLNPNMIFSEEKVNAWRRVLEYLRIGHRAYSGIRIQYCEDLVIKIIDSWSEDEGPLQFFFEKHFDKYLPWKNNRGDISTSLLFTLEDLERQNKIKLISKQDLPAKSYFGKRKIKWIKKGEKHENTMC